MENIENKVNNENLINKATMQNEKVENKNQKESVQNFDNLKEIIAKNLILYRTKAKFSQLELANKINYSDKSISKWERGLGTPDCFVLKQLADLYSIKIDDFFVEGENAKKINVDFAKSKQRKHLMISLLSSGLVWLVATLCFVSLSWFKLDFAWLSFIVALPVNSIVLIVLAKLWWKYYYVGIYSSTLCWSTALTLHLALPMQQTYLFYFVCIPLQILIAFWVVFHYARKNKKIDTKK